MEHQCRIVLKIQFLAIFMEVQNNLLGLGKVVIVTGPCHPRNHDDYRDCNLFGRLYHSGDGTIGQLTMILCCEFLGL